MQTRRLITPAVLMFAVLLGGCASYGGTSTPANQMISVQYGIVQQVQPTQLDASTPKGALLGGLLGLAVAAGTGGSTEAQVAATAGGALAGGLIQEARKSDNRANQYTVRLNSGGTIAIVTDNTDIVQGDCVSVEQGQQANIRRVSSVMCTSVASASHPAYPQLHDEDVAEASQCEQAKQQVLKATTPDEVSIATQKMRALCQG